MILCEYGCGQRAKYQFKNGKWCCSNHWLRCPEQKKRYKGKNNPFYHKTHTKEVKKRLRKASSGKNNPWYGKKRLEHSKRMKGNIPGNKLTINQINNRYPFFSQIEEMRYNPDKPGEKEIQVHCKNHLCPNSKEKGGWFTPTKIQFYERIRQLEKDYGSGGCYFYCSDRCKTQCPLFNLKSDPLKETDKPFTQEEYEIFREFILKRDNYKCQYCEKKATEVHHERPQKLEPFFALDPDLAWSVCKKCHYKYGHKTGTECSTGKLAKLNC